MWESFALMTQTRKCRVVLAVYAAGWLAAIFLVFFYRRSQ